MLPHLKHPIEGPNKIISKIIGNKKFQKKWKFYENSYIQQMLIIWMKNPLYLFVILHSLLHIIEGIIETGNSQHERNFARIFLNSFQILFQNSIGLVQPMIYLAYPQIGWYHILWSVTMVSTKFIPEFSVNCWTVFQLLLKVPICSNIYLHLISTTNL